MNQSNFHKEQSVVFDNEQVIGKTYTINSRSSVPASVITSHTYINVHVPENIQNDDYLSPRNWRFSDLTTEQKNNLTNYHVKTNDYFRERRNEFIDQRLKVLLHESKTSKYEIDDYVNKKTECEHEKICIKCNASNDITYRKCTACGVLLRPKIFDITIDEKDEDTESYDPYIPLNVQIPHDNIETSIITGEPDLLNPSGFKGARRVKSFSYKSIMSGPSAPSSMHSAHTFSIDLLDNSGKTETIKCCTDSESLIFYRYSG